MNGQGPGFMASGLGCRVQGLGLWFWFKVYGLLLGLRVEVLQVKVKCLVFTDGHVLTRRYFLSEGLSRKGLGSAA